MVSTPGNQASYTGNHHVITSIPEWQQGTLGRWRFGTYVPVDESTVMVFKMDLDDQDAYTEFDLSTIAGNPLDLPLVDPDDGHYGIAIGVDGLGRIHLSGNGHSDPIHCVESTNPLDITAWTDTSAAIEALLNLGGPSDTTYKQYVSLMDGTLLWFLDREPPTGTPGRDIVQFRRGPAATTWTFQGVVYEAESAASTAPPGESCRAYQFGHVCFDDGSTYGALLTGGAYRTSEILAEQSQQMATPLYSTDGGLTYYSMAGAYTATPGSDPLTMNNAQLAGGLDRILPIIGNSIAVDPNNGFFWIVARDELTATYQMFHYEVNVGWDMTEFFDPGWSCPTMHTVGDRLYTLTASSTPPFRVRLQQIDGDSPFAPVVEMYLGDMMPRDGSCNPLPDPIALREGRFETLVMDGDVPRIFGFGPGWRVGW